jgi:hypothetical protein
MMAGNEPDQVTMKYTSHTPPRQGEPWTRDRLIELLGVAAAVGEYSFIRKTALSWLAAFPGDLPLQLIHAQATARDLGSPQALPLVEKLCLEDPVYAEAQQLRVELAPQDETSRGWYGEFYGLMPGQRMFRDPKIKKLLPSWAEALAQMRKKLRENDIQGGLNQLPTLLGSDPGSSLAAITHLELLVKDPDTPEQALRQLAEHYHRKYPECLAAILLLAETMIKGGQSDAGVAMLHKAASGDITGQVAVRLWGEGHPFQHLWPEDLETYLEIPIPARVSGAMGWNQLPSASAGSENNGNGKDFHSFSEIRQSDENPAAETLIRIDDDLESGGRKEEKRAGDRFPMYVVFSTRKGLENKYGPETAAILIEEMKKTTLAIRLKPGWGAITLLADDPSSMANFGLKPTLPDDPWALKLALADLDNAMQAKGLMIGALLIVGGPDVVPYHRLPNPVADVDADVPSDNPYGTTDENYFIPEWPVGRLPGGSSNDPGLLLDMLRHVADHHLGKSGTKGSLWERVLAWLRDLFAGAVKTSRHSFGYAAEAWKEASQQVFNSIQERGDLVTSPPYGKDTEIPVPIARYGYFNLHGVEDSPEWYGQKDFSNESPGPDYPIALRPQDINAYDDAPILVFSEACYGTHLTGRDVDDSISLKYLSRGSLAVVGSSVTAYGSVSAPLIAADLLADHFWKFINQGLTSGIALQKAKIELAREMNSRQGYLDGEDQKTLISFLHFGDPLAIPQTAVRKEPKTISASREAPAQVKTVCDRSNLTTDIPSTTLMHVKQIVKRYLPGMEDAEMILSSEKSICSGEDHQCPTAQFGRKVHEEALGQRHVVTLSKKLEVLHNSGKTIHRQYARVTFNKSGKMVKLAVSR